MLTHIKTIAVIGLAVFLSACNLLGGGAKSGESAQAGPSIVGAVVQARIQQKGPQMFCLQPTYQKCLGVDENQCLTEQNTFKDKCFETAQNLSGGANVSSAAFATHYASCMTLNHSLMHPDRAFEIKSCVADANFDYAAMLRAILY